MNPSASKRWRFQKLPKRELQLKLTLKFVGLSALAMLLQGILFTAVLVGAAMELPHDGSLLLEATNGLVLKVAAVSFLVFLPLTFVVGILSTFRIAGPIYRFEQFLKAVARGEQQNPCKIRKGDELTELCDIVNQATEPLRRAPSPKIAGGYSAHSTLPAKSETGPAKAAETSATKPEETPSPIPVAAPAVTSADGSATVTATPEPAAPAHGTASPEPALPTPVTVSPEPAAIAAAMPTPAAPMQGALERDPAPTCP